MTALGRLLNPRSVALVGASERASAAASVVFGNLRAQGFAGPVYPVNPRYAQVYGQRCYASVADLPADVDAVFVGLAAAAAAAAIEEAARAGIRAAVTNASGFADGGPDGAALQARMASSAEAAGMALCGPNNMGFINFLDGVSLWTGGIPHQAAPGSVALISQSGSVAIALTEHPRRLPFAYVVTAGNEAVLTAADYLDATVADPRVATVLLFLETVRDPARFAAAARRAAGLGKRIVALKVGRSEIGSAAVAAHTGGLAGEQAVYDAYFRSLGVVAVRDLDELIEAAVLFTAYPQPPARPAVAATTVSGGEAALVADLGAAAGVSFAPFGQDCRDRLAPHFPDFWTVRNPLDVWGLGWDAARFGAAMDVLAAQEEFDCTVCFVDAPAAGGIDVELVGEMAAACVQVRQRTGRPFVFVNNTAGPVNAQVGAVLAQAGIPYLSSMRTGLAVLGRWLASGIPGPAPEIDASLDGWCSGSDAERLAALRSHGIPMVACVPVASAEEAVAQAQRFGGAVVLKGAASDLLHKTELGLVRTGLRDAADIRAAFAELSRALARSGLAPDAHLELQPMLGRGVELLLGARNDTPFGPVLVVGAGGVLTELLDDASLRIGPVDAATARAMLAETRAGRLLQGYRGQGPFDTEGVVEAIVAFSRLAARLPAVATMEINPLIALPAGQGAFGVDVAVEFRPQPRAA